MQETSSFEKSLAELERIVKKLEEGSVPLAEMVELYEAGTLIGKQCMDILEAYEGKLSELSAPDPEDEE